MTRAAAFFAALIAIGVLFLLSAIDFGKLPSIPFPTSQTGECNG